MNIYNVKKRLTDIEYQFLKGNTTVYTDEQLVTITKELLAGVTEALPDEDIVENNEKMVKPPRE